MTNEVTLLPTAQGFIHVHMLGRILSIYDSLIVIDLIVSPCLTAFTMS